MEEGGPSGGSLRVLLVCQPTTAGTARHVADLAEGLGASGGVDVTVACPGDGWLAGRLSRAGIATVELPMTREIRPMADLRAFVRLLRLCRRLRPDVLHAHSSKAGFLGRVAGRLCGVPAVLFTPHCWSFQSATGRRRTLYIALERFASRFCDLTVAVSRREADEAVELRVLTAERVRVIPNGVGPREFEVVAEGSPRDIPFLSVGRLDEQKGYAYLIEALARVVKVEPSARLVIVGDGPMRVELEALAASLGIAGAIDFEGERPDAGPYLRRAHAFVLASLWEGLPYTVIEAMAAGLPVVCTDVGGCPELVRPGETGLIVPARDPDALADAMRVLWADEGLRRRMGAAARARAGADLRLEDCVAANRRAYGDVLAAVRAAIEITPALLFGRRGAAALLAIAAVWAVLATADGIAFGNRIAPGVRVGAVDVGGATIPQAMARIDEALAATVTVSPPGASLTFALRGHDAGIDVRDAVTEAYSVGRVGALPERFGQRVAALAGRLAIPVAARRGGAVGALVDRLRAGIDRAPVDAGFRLRDGAPAVVGARPGVRVRVGRLLAEIGRAALSGSTGARRVEVPVTTLGPGVTDADARAHLADVAAWTSRPAVGAVAGVPVTLDPATLASCLTVEGADLGVSAARLAPVLRAKRLPRTAPRNARFNVSGGVPYVVAGVPGAEVDATATASSLRAALRAGRPGFTVVSTTVQPDVTAADLRELGITHALSSFSTRFHLGVDGRDRNIALAASAIRGRVVGPGEVFSLNRTTGPRGRTSGYKEALIFLKGKVVPGIGGGVCQVSSTLYDAALLAGLHIVERHSHSMAVSYMGPGRDATAYYPTLDLQFQNTTGKPIMIWTEVRGDRLTIEIYGSSEKPDIRIVTDVRQTIHPIRHMVYDSTLPHNGSVVDAVGRPGYLVSSWRLTYRDGVLVKREPLATDVYQPRQWIVRVGI